MIDTDDNLFDDVIPTEETTQEVTEVAKTDQSTEVDESKTGEKETTAESPSEGEEGAKGKEDGKMIPEHRFKAALKDVQDKLDAATQKIQTLEATSAPDKETDPEGYAFHVKMEASKAVMREFTDDYDEVILHYKTMADANPFLNEKVAAAPLPAKFAYDLAKNDMEIRDLKALKNSDEWKEFQEFKKTKSASKQSTEAGKLGKQISDTLTSKVPNLNKATNVPAGKAIRQDDDELFAGAL